MTRRTMARGEREAASTTRINRFVALVASAAIVVVAAGAVHALAARGSPSRTALGLCLAGYAVAFAGLALHH